MLCDPETKNEFTSRIKRNLIKKHKNSFKSPLTSKARQTPREDHGDKLTKLQFITRPAKPKGWKFFTSKETPAAY